MILIVDDQPDAVTPLARLLNKVGHEAVVKPCGPDALDHMKAVKPSLVVLDVMMPGMDGMTCLQIIRATPGSADVPVVMYSADFSHDRVQEAKRLGAQEYLVKGAVMWPEFLAIVNKYVAAGATGPVRAPDGPKEDPPVQPQPADEVKGGGAG